MAGIRQKRRAYVDRETCVACGCCVKVCPLKAIDVYRGLYAQVDEEKCVGCGRCAKECPATVIEIREVLA
ncbi:MAG: 4Fe-4S binding protein [Eubacteriales bacterium]|nr:4Fe-4S binding protein [Eubacteriales bacterium]